MGGPTTIATPCAMLLMPIPSAMNSIPNKSTAIASWAGGGGGGGAEEEEDGLALACVVLLNVSSKNKSHGWTVRPDNSYFLLPLVWPFLWGRRLYRETPQ